MGYVIECLVEAYILTGARGKLTTARPNPDVDHKDFLVDERGGYKSLYIQVKGSPNLQRYGILKISVDFRAGTEMADPRLLYVFCLFDIETLTLTRVWLVPSSSFHRLAPATRLKNGRIRYSFQAGKTGKWSKFEIPPTQLGAYVLRRVRRLHRLSTRRAKLLAA